MHPRVEKNQSRLVWTLTAVVLIVLVQSVFLKIISPDSFQPVALAVGGWLTQFSALSIIAPMIVSIGVYLSASFELASIAMLLMPKTRLVGASLV